STSHYSFPYIFTLSLHDALPIAHFLIRRISFTGHTVFTNEPTFGETFTRISGGVCRKSSRGVRVEHPTGCSDRRTCLNSINASSHYSESFLRSRYFFVFHADQRESLNPRW